MSDKELIAEAALAAPQWVLGRVTGEHYLRELIHRLAAAIEAHQWQPGGPQCDGCDNGVMPAWAHCVYCGHPLPAPPETMP